MAFSRYLRQGWYLAAALAGVGVVCYLQAGAPDEPRRAPAADAGWNAPIGPGRMGGAPRHAAPELDADEPPPGDNLSIDAAGQLQPSLQLRVLFDYFLIRGDGASLAARADQLRAYLARQLTGPAGAQAEALLQTYLGYVRAHDELLAHQQLALAPDALPDTQQLERLAVWQAQRARLRQGSFSPALLQAWFGGDDSALADALAELRARHGDTADNAGNDSEAEADTNTLRQRRLHGAAQQAARDNEIVALLHDATLSYAAAAAQERQWRANFARFRAAATQLGDGDGDGGGGGSGNGSAGNEREARQRKLEALRVAIFPTEAERIRARASGIE